MHRHILHNCQIHSALDPVLAAGQVGLLNGWGVFSTIKVIDGVLFAWERHWARMQRDAHKMRVPMEQDPREVRDWLLKLVEANQAWNSTLRVVVVRNAGGVFSADVGRPSDVIAFTADLRDWGSPVRLRYVANGRHAASEFAGVKILAWAANLTWLEAAHSEGYDEVVLLNERGEVAECTSANLFAAVGGEVWTPPLESGCLPGVTRDLLLHEIQVPGVTVRERTLLPADCESADEVFITSTTRDLLAVSEISGKAIADRGRTREKLGAAFREYTQAYTAGLARQGAGLPT